MSRRRGNNEGTIYQRPDGRWCAQVTLNGRRLTTYRKTQRECREWLKEIIAQIDEGLTIAGARATLTDYLERWLETSKPSLRTRSWQQYSQIVRQHIIPSIGTIRLKDLRPDQVQLFYTAKIDNGTGVRTVQLIHAVLHRSLAQAMKWGLIARNPSDPVDKPRPKRTEMHTLDLEQVRALLKVVEGEPLEALYHLAVTTGLRQGELLGLRWTDLHWETGTLHVQRQLLYVRGRGFVFAEPKSAAGRRVVTLGAAMLGKLREHRERQELRCRIVGERWQDNELIFPSSIGTPIEARNLVRSLRQLTRQAGLPEIRFHDLRHTAATLMLQQGVHPKVVQERLGHSTISLTLDTYSHVLPSLQQDAADKLDSLLG
jgi:integrase